MRKRWNQETKDKARNLRNEGLSIREISKKLGIAGSTLHLWVSDLKRPKFTTEKEKLEHLKKIRPLASLALRRQKENRVKTIKESVSQEIDKLDLVIPVLRSILAMLYWTEGSKTKGPLAFANTDPKLSFLFITLLRKCYEIDESKLRVRLHLHYYHKIKECRKYWSELLEISEAKFGKIYIKPRSKTKKFRPNFAGICFIRYYDESLKIRLMETAFAVGDKITKHVSVA